MYVKQNKRIRLPILALKPRVDVNRSPKTGVSVDTQKGLMSSKMFFKKQKSSHNFYTSGILFLSIKLAHIWLLVLIYALEMLQQVEEGKTFFTSNNEN